MKTFKQYNSELRESALSRGLFSALNEPSKAMKIKIKQHNAAVKGNYSQDHPWRMDKAPNGHKFTKSGIIKKSLVD